MGLKIMLIEPDDSLRDVLTKLLENTGGDSVYVNKFKGFKEGIKAIKSDPEYNLIFTDIGYFHGAPGILDDKLCHPNGLDVIDEVNKIRKEIKSPNNIEAYLIITSASTELQDLAKSKAGENYLVWNDPMKITEKLSAIVNNYMASMETNQS